RSRRGVHARRRQPAHQDRNSNHEWRQSNHVRLPMDTQQRPLSSIVTPPGVDVNGTYTLDSDTVPVHRASVWRPSLSWNLPRYRAMLKAARQWVVATSADWRCGFPTLRDDAGIGCSASRAASAACSPGGSLFLTPRVGQTSSSTSHTAATR